MYSRAREKVPPKQTRRSEMKKQEISVKATEIINGYLSKGYVIYPKAMGGSQGQDFDIVLRNGNDGVAISGWKNVSYRSYKKYGMSMDTYEIWIERFNVGMFEAYGYVFWLRSGKDSYKWKEDQQVISYFKPSHDKDWYVTEDEAVAIHEKQRKRAWLWYKNNHISPTTKTFKSDNAKKLAMDIARKHYGYKRTKLEDVDSISLVTDSFGHKSVVIDLNRQPSKNASTKLVISR